MEFITWVIFNASVIYWFSYYTILTHEFGHFLTLKLFKIRTDTVVVGYGPSFSFALNHTTFQIGVCPSGGANFPNRGVFESKSAFERFCVYFSGPALELLCSFVAIFFIYVYYPGFLFPTIFVVLNSFLHFYLGAFREGMDLYEMMKIVISRK